MLENIEVAGDYAVYLQSDLKAIVFLELHLHRKSNKQPTRAVYNNNKADFPAL
jgi:hypothetical protein